jgi:hypothetical protein
MYITTAPMTASGTVQRQRLPAEEREPDQQHHQPWQQEAEPPRT